MYAITGITGQVGGELGRRLLAVGVPVRAVVRDHAKGAGWAAKGCEVACADMGEGAQLAAAFEGAEAVFILPPSVFDPEPGYPEARRVIDAVVTALLAARPKRVLCLSTIGADAPHDNLLTQRTLLERALERVRAARDLPAPRLVHGERAVGPSRRRATRACCAASCSRPIGHFPMVATRDIGALAAELIQENWQGNRVVELEGPARVSPQDLTHAFATVLGRPVRLRDRAARVLGGAVPCAGDEEPASSHAHAGWLQRGMDHVPGPQPPSPERPDGRSSTSLPNWPRERAAERAGGHYPGGATSRGLPLFRCLHGE